jgi:site-specific DNA-methyltransferase (adenine-specific)
MPEYEVILGDCVEEMAEMEANSIDSIVTDPPYGLKFMGKEFDDLGEGAQQQKWHEAWAREALRVLKPGGHIVAFGGTRTYHRLVSALEDVGFEIRDQLAWMYGSGFPKSMNIGKAIDKAGGVSPQEQASILRVSREKSGFSREELAERVGCTLASVRDWEEGRSRAKGAPLEYMVPSQGYRLRLAEVLGYTKDERRRTGVVVDRRGDGSVVGLGHSGQLTAGGNTSLSEKWEGFGTALKPAHEPICLARKPLIGTVAQNVLEHGTAGLNIDGCRINANGETWEREPGSVKPNDSIGTFKTKARSVVQNPGGRWPANVILTHHEACTEDVCADLCPVKILDEQSGVLKSAYVNPDSARDKTAEQKHSSGDHNCYGKGLDTKPCGQLYTDKGGASRFFYCAKASKSERNNGLQVDVKNSHPTIKPVELMRYLCRLITPPGGVVLDPFMGSGTTGIAAKLEKFSFVGIEQDEEYIEIAKSRIVNYMEEVAHKTSVSRDQLDFDM